MTAATKKNNPKSKHPIRPNPMLMLSLVNARPTGDWRGTHCQPFHHQPPERGNCAGVHCVPFH